MHFCRVTRTWADCIRFAFFVHQVCLFLWMSFLPGKGGKNRRRGKNENESEKRELVFKEDGQGKQQLSSDNGLVQNIKMLYQGVTL